MGGGCLPIPEGFRASDVSASYLCPVDHVKTAYYLFHPRLGLSTKCSACSFGGIHVWHMPVLTEIFGDDSVLQFGGGTLGQPWGNAPGAVAN
ncbi:hypothetical protein R6Q59_013428 [Mikania micrantha]